MNRNDLYQHILSKRSYLCIGLDTDPAKIPAHLNKYEDPVFEFNRQIIEATSDLCVAYKPNMAFYECQGQKGWQSLEKTMEVIPSGIFTIADAKRGDIDNTATKYAEAFFKKFNFDSVTLSPYMGRDAILPFLSYTDKWAIVLALTSNKSHIDFELTESNGIPLFEQVMQQCISYAHADQLMFVCGATQSSWFERLRKIAPEHFFLVPGVGTQGGDLDAISKYGMNSQCGLLVNVSRDILYASSGSDFADAARLKAISYMKQMDNLLRTMGHAA